jgi:hypothetical protein
MSKLKELASKYGVTASIVGGSLVVGSVFGQCVLSPPEAAVESVETPDVEEAEPAPADTPPAEESEGA